ncbi:MAG: ribosome recycling factor [Alphaproteobacteria bacterium]|nr:ribosome recycling factor [Alphaproteobacteria bacterium]
MDFNSIKNQMQESIQKANEALRHDFAGLQTGRATTALLDGIRVEAYGSVVPLNQVGAVSVPDARTLSVTVWDKNQLKAVEKAIVEANLGLNPMNDGQMIRISIPPLSEERRVEIIKIANRFTEDARVSVRNARRDAMDALKAAKATMPEDDFKRYEKEIQDLTDKAIGEMDAKLKEKEAELKQV